jgi:hypothetical protein
VNAIAHLTWPYLCLNDRPSSLITPSTPPSPERPKLVGCVGMSSANSPCCRGTCQEWDRRG